MQKAISREPKRVDLWVKLGDALYNAARIKEAGTGYQRALALNPDDPQALFGLGRIALKLRDNRKAATLFQKASKLRPKWPQLYNHWAIALRGLGDLDGAKRLQQHSFDINLREVKQRNRKAGVLISQGRFEEALRELKTARAASPRSAITHVNIGAALKGMGRIEEAREFFTKAVSLGPDLFEAHYNLGLQMFSDGHFPEALTHFQKSADLKPEDPFSRNAMGNTLVRLDRPEEALKAFLEASERKADFAEAWNGAGEVLLELGDTKAAIEYFHFAVDSKSSFLRARMNLGLALEKSGDPEGANQEYQEVVRQDPAFSTAQLKLAEQEIERGDIAAAIGLLEYAVKHCKDNPDLFFLLGRSYLDEGEVQAGVWAAMQATENRKEFFEAWQLLGDARTAFEDQEGAVHAYRTALALRNDDVPTLKRLSQVLLAMDWNSEAEGALERVQQGDPKDWEVAVTLADMRKGRGDLVGAMEALETAGKAGDLGAEALETIAELCLQARYYDKALSWIERAIAAGREGGQPRLIKGHALAAIDEFSAAIDEYMMAIYLDPSLVAGRLALGKLLVKKDRFDEGIAELQIGIAEAEDPVEIDVQWSLAFALSETGKTTEAIKTLTKALESDPGSGKVHNLLAALYFKRGDFANAWAHTGFAAEGGNPVDGELSEKIRKAMDELG
ncbi:MAG: tetratricopeptide repeat protein [Planctomycetota bacterium]